MTFVATGRYLVLHADEVLSFTGDPTDAGMRARGPAVRGSVLQVSRDVLDEAQHTTGTVLELVGRLPPGTVVEAADVLQDERSGARFVVEDVTPRGLCAFGAVDVRMALSALAWAV